MLSSSLDPSKSPLSNLLDAETALEHDVDDLVRLTVDALQEKQRENEQLKLEIEHLKQKTSNDGLSKKQRQEARWKAELDALQRRNGNVPAQPRVEERQRSQSRSVRDLKLMEEQQRQIQQLQTEVEALTKETAECHQLIQESEKNAQHMDKEVELLRAQLSLSEENEKRLEHDCQRWQQQYSEISHENSRLGHEHDQLSQQLEQVTAQLEAQTGEYQLLKEQMTPLADRLQEELEAKDQLETRLQQVTDETKEVWDYASNLETQLKEALQQLEQQAVDVENLRLELIDKDAMIEALGSRTTDKPRLQQFANSLADEKRALLDENKKMEDQVQETFEDMARLRDATNAKLQAFQEENAILHHHIAELETHIASLEGHIASLENHIGTLENHGQEPKLSAIPPSFAERFNLTVDSPQDSWLQAEQDYLELQAQLEAAKQEAASLEARLTRQEELEAQVEVLKKQHSKTLQQHEQDMAVLRRELDEVRNARLRKRLEGPQDDTIASVGLSRIDEILDPNNDKMDRLLDRLNMSHQDLHAEVGADGEKDVIQLVQDYVKRVDVFLANLKETASVKERLERDLEAALLHPGRKDMKLQEEVVFLNDRMKEALSQLEVVSRSIAYLQRLVQAAHDPEGVRLAGTSLPQVPSPGVLHLPNLEADNPSWELLQHECEVLRKSLEIITNTQDGIKSRSLNLENASVKLLKTHVDELRRVWQEEVSANRALRQIIGDLKRAHADAEQELQAKIHDLETQMSTLLSRPTPRFNNDEQKRLADRLATMEKSLRNMTKENNDLRLQLAQQEEQPKVRGDKQVVSQKLIEAVKMWRDRKEFYKREYSNAMSKNEELQQEIAHWKSVAERGKGKTDSREIARLEERHATYKQQVANLTQQKENLRDVETQLKEDNLRLAQKLLRTQYRLVAEVERADALSFQKAFLTAMIQNLEDYEKSYSALLLKHAKTLPIHIQDRLNRTRQKTTFRGAVHAVIFLIRARTRLEEKHEADKEMKRFKSSVIRSH